MGEPFNTHWCALDFDYGFRNSILVRMEEEEDGVRASRTEIPFMLT